MGRLLARDRVASLFDSTYKRLFRPHFIAGIGTFWSPDSVIPWENESMERSLERGSSGIPGSIQSCVLDAASALISVIRTCSHRTGRSGS